MNSTKLTQEYINRVRECCFNKSGWCLKCPRRKVKGLRTIEQCRMEFSLQLAEIILELIERL